MESWIGLLWGIKTQAWLDVWTIEHLLSGLSVGAAVKQKNHKIIKKLLNLIHHNHHSYYLDVTGVLFLAYLWETLEHYLEVGLGGARVEYWLQGVEFWGNRLMTDPLMLVIGYLIASRFPLLVWPARILSLLWLIVHIFVFPHSMFLHEIL